jgi:hypothetical protein
MYIFHMLQNTEYKGDYHRYHQTIKHFWDVFHDLTLEDKKKFLCTIIFYIIKYSIKWSQVDLQK